jgi:murein DD-endopeptidase MepM/ murein hydrolase activator NlpD
MSERLIIGGAAAIFLFVLVRWTAWPANSCEQTITPVEQAVEEIERPVEYFYGIPVDSFEVVQGIIRRNELLGNILHDHGVSNRQVYELSLLPREEFDVRRVKAGNRYALFLDTVGVRYLVYEQDRVKYAVVHFEDSVHVESREKPVEVRNLDASGEVVLSLWEDLRTQQANPMLALELSEIYAWSIDFFGLQPGDRYKVIYDETFVDSLSVGITRIHAAWFYHGGREFWAIPFEQDSVLSFFDEEGNSLRKAFLKAPLRFSRISSRFSHSRLHPILKIRRPHHGVDYAAPTGTPVLAVGDGQVTAAAYERGGGNYVKIKHNGVYNTSYLHLSRFGKGIRRGAWVKQGDVIGYVGSTGLSTGPHLDFRFYKNGAPVDPLKVEAPPVEPIHEENLIDFALVRNSIMAELNAVQ